MTFLSPYLLFGAAAAAIPIALHFFFRSRYRTVPWAAMKFLLTSIEQTSRRLRFQELLLLLVRVLLLALLALALARPVMTMMGGSGGQAVDAVFVFDISYSMGARDGEVSRLERARAAALHILEQLPPHSTVHLVTCADRAAKLGPREPNDLDTAREIICDLKLTHLATDLYPGIVEAKRILELSKASTRELYLFSDMQKLGWEAQSGGMVAGLKEIADLAAIHLVRCGTRPLKNVAIVGIAPQTGSPRPGERVGFSVLVRNSGAEAVEDIEVSLTLDDDPKQREVQSLAEIEPGQTRAVTLTGKFTAAGLRVVSAAITHDDLPGDNRFDQVVEVRDRINVLIVDGGPANPDTEKASSFRVALALNAMGCAVRKEPPKLASPALLKEHDLCVLVNVALEKKLGQAAQVVSPEFFNELERFVRRGKSLMIFAGDHVAPASYNRLLGDKRGLLPSEILGRLDVPYDAPLRLNRDTFVHPAYQHLKDKAFDRFNGVEMYRALDMAEPIAGMDEDPSLVLVRYSRQRKDDADKTGKDAAKNAVGDGKPAILLGKVGAGQVLLVTTAPERDLKTVVVAEKGKKVRYLTPTWTTWLIEPMESTFVVFLRVSLAQLLHEESQNHNLVAGQALAWYPREKEARAYMLTHPDGEEERLGLPEEEMRAGASKGRPVVRSGRLSQAGTYRLVVTTPPQPRALEAAPAPPKATTIPLAVTPDLHESENLDSLSDTEIDRRLGFQPLHLTAGRDLAALERVNREWTPWLLLVVLLLAVGESVLAWWCGRAW